MQITLTTKIEIPESVLEDVLTTAVEGGISYWAGGRNIQRREDLRVWEITVWDQENRHEEFVLNADSMAKGVRLLHEAVMDGTVHPNSEIGSQLLHHLFADQDDDGLNMGDVVLADAIVQMACFEEIRFG